MVQAPFKKPKYCAHVFYTNSSGIQECKRCGQDWYPPTPKKCQHTGLRNISEDGTFWCSDCGETIANNQIVIKSLPIIEAIPEEESNTITRLSNLYRQNRKEIEGT